MAKKNEKFNIEGSSLFSNPVEKAKSGRPLNESLVRDNSVQEGLPDNLTRATFIVDVELLELMKDYAYTERLTLREVASDMMKEYLDNHVDKKTLIHRPKK